jgi:hypothetical protein
VPSEQLDPLSSPVLRRELPGLAAALDEEAVRGHLQEVLFGAEPASTIERCNPGQAIYLAGGSCGLRYEMEVRDQATGELSETLVIGRVFRDRQACAEYLNGTLAPVARRVRHRPELRSFAAAATVVDALNMVVHAFPIDGDLPALVDVTEPGSVLRILEDVLPAVRAQRFAPSDCRVELAHYGRQQRCTLRYRLERGDSGASGLVVYGKVAADGSGARTMPVITALRDRLGDGTVDIPRVLGFRPDLQLMLLEALPGRPQVARLLKARLAGTGLSTSRVTGPGTGPGNGPAESPELEEAVERCGRIAAAIHGSAVEVERRRTFDDELDWQERSIGALRRVCPELGIQLQEWLRRTADHGRATEPLPLCFGHGDFTYTQLLVDGPHCGLVDFDTVCLAEPALDIGQFLAYQRLAILKDQRPDAPLPATTTERLCTRFLDAYIDARGSRTANTAALHARVAVYEALMLLRLAIHSWQKLKVGRLECAMTLLEERLACLA